MIGTLEQAIAEIAGLPDADQEQIDRELPFHVEKLNALRFEIDKGIHSLGAGEGRPQSMDDFLRRKNSRHGG
jgi:hypothetical protein